MTSVFKNRFSTKPEVLIGNTRLRLMHMNKFSIITKESAKNSH